MPLQHEIVVTGIAVVSPIGIGKDPFWTSLHERRSGIRRLDDIPADPNGPTPIGGVVADFDPKQYVRPRKSLKVMNRDIQLGFTAADLAWTDGGLAEKPVDPERLGVLFGAGMMPCELDELAPAYRGSTVGGEFDFQRWGPTAMTELFPLWMLKYLPNMPACHIAIAKEAHGPNNSLTMCDVSSLAAMIEATRILDRKQADALLVGGVGSWLHPATWVRNHIYELARHDGPVEAASRPFDARRNGMVNSESAAAFLVERRDGAAARGAAAAARVLGCGEAFAPSRLCKNPPLGEAVCRSIELALQSAGLTPADVGFVLAHGISTVENDRMEARAIRDALGDVPVTALKSYWGHSGPAAGALELAAAVLSFQHGEIPPTLNYEYPDPECPIRVVHGGPMPLERRTALVLSHSNQGQAAAVLLGGE
jgi:3-oxoacyl-[acyl-carrier-protein] synthase II